MIPIDKFICFKMVKTTNQMTNVGKTEIFLFVSHKRSCCLCNDCRIVQATNRFITSPSGRFLTSQHQINFWNRLKCASRKRVSVAQNVIGLLEKTIFSSANCTKSPSHVCETDQVLKCSTCPRFKTA
jgi:hypothetical protein